MIRHVRNTDFALFALGLGFTAASAGLSGYFGWLRAEGAAGWVQLASAVICGGIAIGFAMWVIRRERLRYAGVRTAAYRRASIAVVVFAIANLATDYMATNAVLSLSSTDAGNANTIAGNARKTLASIERQISEIEHDTNGNKITYRPPPAYRAQIDAKQEEMRQEERRGCARPPCRGPDYLKDKEEIAHLETLLASATKLEELRARLPNAKAEVAKHGIKADAAYEPVDALTKLLWTQNLQISKDDQQWGQIIFILFLTSVFSYGIYSIGAEQGRRMGPLPDYSGFDFADIEDDATPVRKPKPRMLEAPEGHEPEPIPLKAEPVPDKHGTTSSTKVTVNTYQSHDKDAIARLMKELEEDFGLTPKH